MYTGPQDKEQDTSSEQPEGEESIEDSSKVTEEDSAPAAPSDQDLPATADSGTEETPATEDDTEGETRITMATAPDADAILASGGDSPDAPTEPEDEVTEEEANKAKHLKRRG